MHGVRLLCVLFLFTGLFACSDPPDPAQQLRHSLDDLVSALQARDVERSGTFFALDIEAQGGKTRQQIESLMRMQFRRYAQVKLRLHDTQIRMQAAHADVLTRAELGGSRFLAARGRFYSVQMRWVRQQAQWKLQRVAWQANGNAPVTRD